MSAYVESASIQFENANSLRDYPFDEGCSLLDDQGKALPKDVVVDLHMTAPCRVVTNPPSVKLASAYLSKSMLSVCFTSESGGMSAVSVTVSKEDFRPYFPYRLERLYGSQDIGGIVTFGDIDFPFRPETYRYGRDNQNSIVHECCVAAIEPARLRGFVDLRSGERVSGDVDIDFSGYIDASVSDGGVRLSISEDSASLLKSKCAGLSESPDLCGATPITSINGIRPDEHGNIVLWFH